MGKTAQNLILVLALLSTPAFAKVHTDDLISETRSPSESRALAKFKDNARGEIEELIDDFFLTVGDSEAEFVAFDNLKDALKTKQDVDSALARLNDLEKSSLSEEEALRQQNLIDFLTAKRTRLEDQSELTPVEPTTEVASSPTDKKENAGQDSKPTASDSGFAKLIPNVGISQRIVTPSQTPVQEVVADSSSAPVNPSKVETSFVPPVAPAPSPNKVSAEKQEAAYNAPVLAATTAGPVLGSIAGTENKFDNKIFELDTINNPPAVAYDGLRNREVSERQYGTAPRSITAKVAEPITTDLEAKPRETVSFDPGPVKQEDNWALSRISTWVQELAVSATELFSSDEKLELPEDMDEEPVLLTQTEEKPPANLKKIANQAGKKTPRSGLSVFQSQMLN